MAPLCNHTETKENLFAQDAGISPKLQQALQPVRVHELGQCAWRRIIRLVMTPLCNYTTTKENLFFSRGTHQPVHVGQLAQYAWRWTGRLLMAPLCNHSETKENLFSQDEGISLKLQDAVQPVRAYQLA